jgi:glycerol-3-phosphate dehydrogenase (NAD(P)+)
MKIAVIGAGKWGQALAFALGEKNEVVITSRSKKKLANFVDLKTALEYEYLVIALPAQAIAPWLKDKFINNNQKILVASKGIDIKSKSFLNTVYMGYVDEENLAYISGPSFAFEVQKSLPTALVINSTNVNLAQKYASFFPSFIKTYISDDIIGAEVSGAYKNIIAIASGLCDGLNLGNNARASLIARGLVEMERFGVFFGSQKETFFGLSGAGDLFLTASSTLSRNYRVGFALAGQKKIDDILKDLGEVAEGVYTVQAVVAIAKDNAIYTPIANEIEKIIAGKLPQESLIDLLKS